MAKRQTRRSISLKGATYHRLKVKCDGEGVSVSGWLEDIIAPHIEGIADPGPTKPQPKPVAPAEEGDPASGYFTF